MSKKMYFTMAVPVILGTFTLRIWNLTSQSIWWDEGLAITAASQPWTEIWAFDRFNPPLFSYLLGIWMSMVGRSEWALRYLSVLVGTLVVALGMRLARDLTGYRGALAGGILIGTSAFAWWYSQEVRMYGLLAAETLALALIVERLRVRPKTGLWATLAILEAAALYTHSIGVVVAGWAALTSAPLRSGGKGDSDHRLRRWAVAQVGAALLWLPWLAYGLPRVLGSRTVAPSALTPWEYIRQLWLAITLGNQMLFQNQTLTAVALLPGVMAVALITYSAAVGRDFIPRRALTIILLPAMVYGLMLIRPFLFSPRYVLMCGVLVFAVMGAIAGRTWDKGAVGKVAATVMLTSFIGLNAGAIYLSAANYEYQRDDERALATYLREVLEPGDLIVVPYEDDYTLKYYGVGDAKIMPINTSATPREIISAINNILQGPSRVEVIRWYQAPGDVWGLLDCWLGSHGQAIGHQFVAQGFASRGYKVDWPLPIPELEPVEANFGAAVVVGAAYTNGGPDGTVCVGVRWRLIAGGRPPLYMVATSTNPLGWEIAHSYGMLADVNLQSTSRWAPGDEGWAFALLRFPIGTPDDEYPVLIGLYSEGDPAGYDLIGPTGNPAGHRYEIGRASISAECIAPDEDSLIPVGARMSDGVVLEAWGISGRDTVRPGQTLHVTIRWLTEPTFSDAIRFEVAIEGNEWEVRERGKVGAGECKQDRRVLTWQEITVPATADGTATVNVRLGGVSVRLAELQVESEERLWEQPTFDYEANARFPGVGRLIGFSLGAEEIVAGETLPLTLVWQAAGTSDRAWTVFTHLLDDTGRLIAGHDSQPALGARPTTGWLVGEYIVDPHILQFVNADYSGPATLEIGLYDQSTGERLLTDSGEDHVTLPITLDVR